MKRNLAVLFLLFILPFLAAAQEHQYSSLYLNNGKLRADSTLSISAEQFQVWWQAEQYIVEEIAKNLTYPEVCKRNGIEGHLIMAFDITGTEVKNIRTITTSNSYFTDAGINAVHNTSEVITTYLVPRKGKLKGTYYVPLDFELINLRNEIKKRGTIPILEFIEPLLPPHKVGDEPLLGLPPRIYLPCQLKKPARNNSGWLFL